MGLSEVHQDPRDEKRILFGSCTEAARSSESHSIVVEDFDIFQGLA